MSAASITAVHLSRFAEEIVIWTSPLAGLLLLSDRFTTGSSIMPQKRNPDAAELVRAKTGRIIGALQALLIVMKGLPLAYQKDMQEDKEGAMDALSALSLSIAAMTGMVRDMVPDADAHARGRRRRLFDRDRSRRLAGAHAEDAVPRRAPRHRPDRRQGGVGRRAAACAAARTPCRRSSRASPQDVFEVLSADNSVKSRVSYGGTAPEERAPGGQPLAEGAGAGSG